VILHWSHFIAGVGRDTPMQPFSTSLFISSIESNSIRFDQLRVSLKLFTANSGD